MKRKFVFVAYLSINQLLLDRFLIADLVLTHSIRRIFVQFAEIDTPTGGTFGRSIANGITH